jgi:NAD(P)-dependent dehydrogenase (short-subunit alcohol dehydrogenase family)
MNISSRERRREGKEPDRTVVVTGASSGIGRATALLLVRSGFRVFAGVRREEDADSLRAQGGADLVPIELDVTDGGSIARAVEQVRAYLEGDGLDGLVNNAGIGITVPVEEVAGDVLRHHFEVDVFGQIAVTQAFLPLIRRTRGRIVNMGSVGGHIALPFIGVLCGCKSAFGSLSDSLRMELHPFGIRVSVIEPGSIHTPAVEKTLGGVESAIDALPSVGARRYGPMLRRFTRRAYNREIRGSPPEVVARVVRHALTARRPRIRYRVGRDARLLGALSRFVPDRWLDVARLRVFGLPTSFGALVATPFDAKVQGGVQSRG